MWQIWRKFFPPIEKWPGSDDTPEGMEYWMVTTLDDKGNEAVTGGMMKRQMPQQQGITNFFDVKSVQEYSAKVEQLGGKVISPKHPVPGMVILQYAQIQRIMALVFGETDNTAK
jgi:predicted enzyme related to lactoylglutathione lyase